MARRRSRSRKTGDDKSKLLELAVTAAAVGALLLLLPMFITHPALRPGLVGLRGWGWFAVVLGLMLFGFYRWITKGLGDPRPTVFEDAAREFRRAASASAERADWNDDVRVADVAGFDRRPDSTGSDSATSPLVPTQWSALAFDVIEWRRFEAVCQRLFAQAGFETKSQSHGADGGVDIWLHSKNFTAGPVSVVQCKHWRSKPVGVAEVRQLLGSMAAHKVARGIFATTSTFTEEAKRLASSNAIQLLDRRGLLELIGTRTPQQQHELLQVATAGEFWVPTCASCGVKMVRRASRRSGSSFWGCVNYPPCRTTISR